MTCGRFFFLIIRSIFFSVRKKTKVSGVGKCGSKQSKGYHELNGLFDGKENVKAMCFLRQYVSRGNEKNLFHDYSSRQPSAVTDNAHQHTRLGNTTLVH